MNATKPTDVSTTVHVMPMPPNVRKSIDHIFQRMANEKPIRRLKSATLVHQQLLDAQAEVAQVKRAAVRDLRTQGMTYAAIGDQLGITPSRVKQIESGKNQ